MLCGEESELVTQACDAARGYWGPSDSVRSRNVCLWAVADSG